MQIQIPTLFEMYNRFMQTTSMGTINRYKQNYKEVYLKENPDPATCIECGQCENACPQHLPIRENLKKVVEIYK